MFSKLGQKSFNAYKSRSLMTGGPTRSYGQMTKECADQLAALGITNKNIVFNPS